MATVERFNLNLELSLDSLTTGVECNYPKSLKTILKKHYFVFLDETCISLSEDIQTQIISQTWSNEIGSSNQCNCICYRNYLVESYIPFLLGGLSFIISFLTIIHVSLKLCNFLKTE